MSYTFLTPYTVLTHKFSPGAKDEFGNPVEAWDTPVSQPVIGWGPPISVEPSIPGHDRVQVDLELYAPPEFEIGPHDLVTVNGQTYQVVGYPQTTLGNPFGWAPGMSVSLLYVEG